MSKKNEAQEYKDIAKIYIKMANIFYKMAEIIEDKEMPAELKKEREEELLAQFIVQANKINKIC